MTSIIQGDRATFSLLQKVPKFVEKGRMSKSDAAACSRISCGCVSASVNEIGGKSFDLSTIGNGSSRKDPAVSAFIDSSGLLTLILKKRTYSQEFILKKCTNIQLLILKKRIKWIISLKEMHIRNH